MVDSANKRLRLVFSYWAFLFVSWGLYRFLLRLPEEIEEGVIKPILWLGSVFGIVVIKEKRPLFSSLGWTLKNIFPAFYWGLGVGLVLAFEGILINLIKYGSFSFIQAPYQDVDVFLVALVLSLVTGICEETVFRGFILNRFLEILKKENQVNILVSVGFALIHLPVVFFIYHYSIIPALIYFLLVFLMSLVSGYFFIKTKNVISSVLIHALWWWPIILFR